MSKRTVAFVDGFNLYHAIAKLGSNHFKWVDLRTLVGWFALPPEYDLARVLYFTAYATWMKDRWARHRAYTSALGASGVEVIISKFKKKQRRCSSCGNSYTGHEEKETDVSIGAHLVDLAYQNEYDRALVVSNDSDLCPAVSIVRSRFPDKDIKILTPPGRRSTKGLGDAAERTPSLIKQVHIGKSLLPKKILDASGAVVATRPPEYDPP